MESNEKTAYLIIGIIAISLVLLTLISTGMPMNDNDEYAITAKYIAGIENIKLYTLHSPVYPLIASPLIRLFHNIVSFQLLTVAISILTGLAIWFASKDLKAIALWAFSAFTWMSLGAISPIVPSALLVLIAYCFWNAWNKSGKLTLLALSGLSIGLSAAFYEGGWPVAFVFMLVFFFRKKFSSLMLFLAFAVLGFSLRLGVDYFIFGSAFSSTIKMLLANMYVISGLHPQNYQAISSWHVHLWYNVSTIIKSIFFLSPLIIFSYRLYPKWKEECFFIVFSFFTFMILFSASMHYYLYMMMPIALFLISKVVTKKEVLMHIIVSIPFIIMVLIPLLSTDKWDYNLNSDIKNLEHDYSGNIILDRNMDMIVASKAWNENLQFIWVNDYIASINKNNIFRQQEYHEPIKGDIYRRLFVTIGYERGSGGSYQENLPLVVQNGQKISLEGYSAEKCYREICVYRKTA